LGNFHHFLHWPPICIFLLLLCCRHDLLCGHVQGSDLFLGSKVLVWFLLL
jgi:hypothetical protein